MNDPPRELFRSRWAGGFGWSLCGGRRGAGRVPPGPAGTALGWLWSGRACSAQLGASWTATGTRLSLARGGSQRRGRVVVPKQPGAGRARDLGGSAWLRWAAQAVQASRVSGAVGRASVTFSSGRPTTAPLHLWGQRHGAVSRGWVHPERRPVPTKPGAQAVRADVSWDAPGRRSQRECWHPWAPATASHAVRTKPLWSRGSSTFSLP